MKQFVTVTLFLICCVSYVSGQNFLDNLRRADNSTSGKVLVIQSKTIDELVNGKKHNPFLNTKKDSIIAKNKTVVADTARQILENKGPKRRVTGFRVQAFAGNNSRISRDKAKQIGERLKSEFPNHAVYVHFYTPRWVCRMGNYQTRDEAEIMLQKVRDLGYSSACLVKGKITIQ